MRTAEDPGVLKNTGSTSPNFTCAPSSEDQLQAVSDACNLSLEHKNNEMMGLYLSDSSHPDGNTVVPTALEKFLEAFEQAEPVYLDSPHLSQNGQPAHVAWSALRAATDELLVSVKRDLQQQKTQHMRKQETQLQDIDEQGAAMVGIVDADGLYMHTGGAIYRMLGYLPDELVGRSAFDLVHPDDRAELQRSWALLASQPSMTIPDFRFRAADGSWRWLETTVTRHSAPPFATSYLLKSCDITKRKRSSQAQAESEQRFRLLFNDDTAFAVFETVDGRILDVNPALLAFLKKEKRQMLLQPLADFMPAEVRQLFMVEHLKASQGQKVKFEIETTILGGEKKTLEVIKTPLVVNDKIVGVYASVRDVTERATAQRLIKWQAEQLTTLLESINDAFISLDKDWKLTYINSQAEWLLGISQEGALGVNLWDLFSEKTDSIYRQKYQQAIDTRQTVRFEAYYKRERRWLEVIAYPFAGGLSVLLSDVTKRVEDEKQLKLLALVARNTDNGVVITDAEGRTEWVNDAFVKDTGYTLADLVGRSPGSVLQGPETDPSTVRYIRERMKLQTTFSVTILNYKKSGKKVWLTMDITPLRNEAGELTQFVSVQRNITFRKEVEASQAAMTQDLYQHNRDLQQFSYIISHNLRAPLANALGLANVLTKVDKAGPVFDTTLTHLCQSMTQVDEVLKDLNLILSIRDKKAELALEPLALKDICQQAMQDLEEPLKQCGGHVSLHVEEGLVTRGTRAYLYSIFYNLLSNSIKYRATGRALQVSVECVRGPHGGPTITFTDNGSGFDMYKAGSDVFQLYKRFHTNQRGRGIGLFLVKTHVEAMGGKIEVASEVNFGTRFLIQLDKH